jgi:thioredoxin reductase
VDTILGDDRVMGVRLKDLASGTTRDLPADPWQRTNIPRILAIGDISSPPKMIVTAVAQAAVAAHQAYVEVRSPYWK